MGRGNIIFEKMQILT